MVHGYMASVCHEYTSPPPPPPRPPVGSNFLVAALKKVVEGRGYGEGEEDEEDTFLAVAGGAERPAPSGCTTPLPPGGTTRRVLPPATVGVGVGAGADTRAVTAARSLSSEAMVGGTEKTSGRRRHRQSGGSTAAFSGRGGGSAAQIHEGARGGREVGKEVGGRDTAVGGQVRREEEIELEFTRLKKALFRTRRQEVGSPLLFPPFVFCWSERVNFVLVVVLFFL